PGLLTVRAQQVLAAADLVVTDPDVPAAITAVAADAEVRPAVGDPTQVAQTLVAAAREGSSVVRLLAGDVLTADQVVTEIQAVSRSSVGFEIVPGLSSVTA